MKQKLKILKDAYYYLFSKVIPGIAGLLFIFIFTRVLGIPEYGKYSFLLSKFNLITSFSFGWLNQSVLRYGYSKKNKTSTQTPYLTLIAISIFLSVLFITIFDHVNEKSPISFFLSIFCIFSIGISGFTKALFQANFLPKLVLFYSSCHSLLSIIIPCTFNYFFEIAFTNLLFFSAISFFAPSIYLTLKNINFFKISLSKTKRTITIKKWLKFGIPLSIWGCLGLFLPYLDRLFILNYLSDELLGEYSAINELTFRAFSFLIFPFTMAIHPRIVKLWNNNKKKEVVLLVKTAIKAVMIIFLLTTALIFFFENQFFYLLNIIIPSLSIESKKIILPLAAAGILWQLSFYTHKMIELKEKTYLMILFIIISILINIIGNSIFIQEFGIISTAYVSLLSSVIYCFFTTLYFFKSIKYLNE